MKKKNQFNPVVGGTGVTYGRSTRGKWEGNKLLEFGEKRQGLVGDFGDIARSAEFYRQRGKMRGGEGNLTNVHILYEDEARGAILGEG